MLVLSRDSSESVAILHDGELLFVKVLEVKGDVVRLGFEGPKSFAIKRTELDTPEETK